MQSYLPIMIFTLSGLVGLAIVTWASLTGWREWLAFKQIALKSGNYPLDTPSPTARIELADLRERIRKLEAIASGVDLLP